MVKSEQMCKDFMKQEEADDDEIEQETGIIRVQIGFAIQMQGSRDREAQTIYNSVRAHHMFSRILNFLFLLLLWEMFFSFFMKINSYISFF